MQTVWVRSYSVRTRHLPWVWGEDFLSLPSLEGCVASYLYYYSNSNVLVLDDRWRQSDCCWVYNRFWLPSIVAWNSLVASRMADQANGKREQGGRTGLVCADR